MHIHIPPLPPAPSLSLATTSITSHPPSVSPSSPLAFSFLSVVRSLEKFRSPFLRKPSPGLQQEPSRADSQLDLCTANEPRRRGRRCSASHPLRIPSRLDSFSLVHRLQLSRSQRELHSHRSAHFASPLPALVLRRPLSPWVRHALPLDALQQQQQLTLFLLFCSTPIAGRQVCLCTSPSLSALSQVTR